ncbi:glycosyltransferase family 4 protein [Methylobacterium sp. J-026]|uniref:glycosyltransferase family 4 protein n=1 Tax=Methylobacterium sp. J-026 TaxID=2836624 RepID=UPI001FB9E557|nr:glycosyltransferase family 4 protein [Methylobacterium sp. J-026]MCJ2133672.1 glycosyltransferase family 4 protein [Methylobacterium sp. J-026]
MKILHAANELVNKGNGIVNSAVDLACMQSEAGHDVSFVSSGGGYLDLLSEFNIHHEYANMYIRSGWPFFRTLPRLREIIRSRKPDIVHAHMMTGAVLMRLGRDLAGFGDYGLITTVHNEWRLTSNLMQAGDRVIVLSESGRRAFHKRGFRYDKMHVVRHGILQSPRRRAEVHAREVRPPGRRPPVIITVAGLYRRKGVGDLISAFGDIANEFPDATLQILGSGPDRDYFEALKAQANGSDRIHFQGFIAKPYQALREASVFVLASHTEAFPLAVAEAREAGCAVIATAVGGIPELLDHGRAGILIPPHNPAFLAQELRRVLRDPVELERWRRAARTNLDWLSCKRMADETIGVYRSLLQPS